MLTIGIHAGLALLLIFIVDWISEHSGWWGYRRVSLVQESGEAPAANFAYRVLTPLAYLILTAGAWYALRLDWVVVDYWRVTVLYFAFRLTYAVVLGRSMLLRWNNQLLIATTAIVLSFVLYDRVLRFRRNLLPDPANIANELWIIAVLFVFQTLNRIPQSSADTDRRRLRYIKNRFEHFRARFGPIVKREATELRLEALAYAVMVYESYNRPALHQFIERYVLTTVRSDVSQGPMQVRSAQRLTADASVREGTRLLAAAYSQSIREVRSTYVAGDSPKLGPEPSAPDVTESPKLPSYLHRVALEHALATYNVRSDYPNAVIVIYDDIVEQYFPEIVEEDAAHDDDLG